jgi:hypothetical protein
MPRMLATYCIPGIQYHDSSDFQRSYCPSPTVQTSNCPIVRLKSKLCEPFDRWVELHAVVQK